MMDIKNLLDFYRTEHRIYGHCSHCGEAFRLSEVKLTYGKEPPADIVRALKKKIIKLEDELEDIWRRISR